MCSCRLHSRPYLPSLALRFSLGITGGSSRPRLDFYAKGLKCIGFCLLDVKDSAELGDCEYFHDLITQGAQAQLATSRFDFLVLMISLLSAADPRNSTPAKFKITFLNLSLSTSWNISSPTSSMAEGSTILRSRNRTMAKSPTAETVIRRRSAIGLPHCQDVEEEWNSDIL